MYSSRDWQTNDKGSSEFPLQVLESSCNGKKECSFGVNDATFLDGDNSSSEEVVATDDFLLVSYQCECSEFDYSSIYISTSVDH